MQMTVEVLAKWLYVFQKNVDYQDYCRARKEEDLSKCNALEKKFIKIEELYEDWGDITGVSTDIKSKSFGKWAYPRQALFFRSTRVQWAARPQEYEARSGHLLIEIPLYDKKEETLDAFREYIDHLYEKRGGYAQSDNELIKLITSKIDEPKYRMHVDYNKKIEGRLHKAFYFVYWLHIRPILKNGKLYWGHLSISEIVNVLKQDPNNPFGWEMDEDEKRVKKQGGKVKTIFIDSERTQIKRSINDLHAYIHNTIHGRFPDPTPAV
jgi:hypothetical protein